MRFSQPVRPAKRVKTASSPAAARQGRWRCAASANAARGGTRRLAIPYAARRKCLPIPSAAGLCHAAASFRLHRSCVRECPHFSVFTLLTLLTLRYASRCALCGQDENIISNPDPPSDVGRAAYCGCAAGFFRRIVDAEVECWPCGDLVCDPALQRQMPTCDRFDDEAEPSCVCGPPPAAVAGAACSFQCNAG